MSNMKVKVVNLDKLGEIGDDIKDFMSHYETQNTNILHVETAIDYYLRSQNIVGFAPDILKIINNGYDSKEEDFNEIRIL